MCDFAELFERLSCWNVEQLAVEFCSLGYSRSSSNHVIQLMNSGVGAQMLDVCIVIIDGVATNI